MRPSVYTILQSLLLTVSITQRRSTSYAASAFVITTKSPLKSKRITSNTHRRRNGIEYSDTRLFRQSKNDDSNDNDKRTTANAAAADFELQELRVQLNAMKANGIRSRDLDPVTRGTLENYMRQVATQRPSPVAMADVAASLPQTTWRLVLSTDPTSLNDLPGDATVYMHFVDETNVDYTLQFSKKTFGLNAIKAKSKWTSDETGLVTMVFDKIVTDAFGMENIGVSFFGLLQGRANYVQTAYFDEQYWIERGFDDGTGKEFLNVYVLDEDEWKK